MAPRKPATEKTTLINQLERARRIEDSYAMYSDLRKKGIARENPRMEESHQWALTVLGNGIKAVHNTDKISGKNQLTPAEKAQASAEKKKLDEDIKQSNFEARFPKAPTDAPKGGIVRSQSQRILSPKERADLEIKQKNIKKIMDQLGLDAAARKGGARASSFNRSNSFSL